MMQPRFTFKPVEKLKSRKLIGQIFEEGKSFSHFPFRIIYISPNKNKSHLQTAFSVASKNFRRAVDRNRIKRLMREAYRQQKTALQKALEQNDRYLALFIIYTGNELPLFEKVHDKMGDLLKRLEGILNGNSTKRDNELKK